MPRLMSVSLTEEAVVDRRKTVTRRLGWRSLTPGTRLTLCRKVMGRRRADGTVEPLVRLVDVEVVSVRREPLTAMTDDDVAAEGVPPELIAPYRFADLDGPVKAAEWAHWYAATMGCSMHDDVTRIEWRYIDG